MSVKMKSSGQSGQKRGEMETSYEERRTYGKYPNRDSHPLSQRICSNAISHYSTPFFCRLLDLVVWHNPFTINCLPPFLHWR